MGMKEAILGTRAKLSKKKIELPGDLEQLLVEALDAGEELWVRWLSAAERAAVEGERFRLETGPDGKEKRVFDMSADRENMLARAVCDKDGKRLFDDDDALALSGIPGPLADYLYEEAMISNGMDNDSVMKKKPSRQKGDSRSDSHLPAANGTLTA